MKHVVIGRLDRRENDKKVASSTFKKSFFFVKNLLDFWLSPSLFRKSRKMCVSFNKKWLGCCMTTWLPPIDSSDDKEQV